MNLTVELNRSAEVPVVIDLFADEEFVRWRAQRSAGDGDVSQVDLTGTVAEGFTTVVRRTLPLDLVPPQVRGFTGDRLEIRQAEVWEPPLDGRLVGTVAVEIVGAPVRLAGTMMLDAGPDGGSRLVYDGEIKATVPLFGSIVEDAAAKAVRTTLEAEAQAVAEWLARPAA
jgi:hypothetical protein